MSQKKKQPAPAITPRLQTPSATAPELPATPVMNPFAVAMQDNPTLKKIFFGSLILMLVIVLVGGYNVGFHTDEMDMNNYAKANVAYFTSGGTDTSYLGLPATDETKIESILRFYGSAFEYIPVIFNKMTGLDKSPAEFNSRHVFIQIFGLLALLFTGLIARKFGGWRTSLLAIWLMFLTPAFFGGTLFNSKDIPFCAGYVASLYLILKFLEELPNPTWKTSIVLMLTFALTTGTRIGGMLLIFFLGIFIAVFALTQKGMFARILKNFKSITLKLVAIVFGGIALVILPWPFVLKDPFTNFPIVMTVVKKFPMMIPLPFEGIFTDSLNMPAHYLPKFMFITIPVFILLAIAIGVFIAISKRQKYDWRLTSFILFTSVFPAVYAIMSNVAIYSAWRHFTFIYPGLIVIASMGLSDLLTRLEKPAYQYGLLAACAAGLISPVVWMVKNHPYEYAYFNELSGGYKKAYYEFETDYWKITMKDALEWLMKNEPILRSKDTVEVATDMDMFLKYYIKRHYPTAKVKVILNDVPTRFGQPWRYCVFSKQFIKPDYLERKLYPPSQTIHTENIDGMPECVVLKDTVRLDLLARHAFEVRNNALADSLLTVYFKVYSPDNVGLYGVWSLIKAQLGQNDSAIKLGNESMQLNISPFSNYNARCGLGLAYANLHQWDNAAAKLREAADGLPENNIMALNILKYVESAKAQGATQPPPGK